MKTLAMTTAALAMTATSTMADPAWDGVYGGLSVAETDNNEVAGAFVGYRWNLSTFVVGVEANAVDLGESTYTGEFQVGYPTGDFLPYVSVGFIDNATGSDEVYGIGVDYSMSDNVIFGVKYTDSDAADQFSFRVGFQF